MATVDYFSSFFEIDRLYDSMLATNIIELKADMALCGIRDEIANYVNNTINFQEFTFILTSRIHLSLKLKWQ